MKRKTRFRVAIDVRHGRTEGGFTVQDFRDQIGISQTHLYEVLNGNRSPSDETDRAITQFIEAEMDRLIEHETSFTPAQSGQG